MCKENTAWVEELFFILNIPAYKEEWQKRFDETLDSLKHEVQFAVSTLNNNEQQLIQEAQKRVTSHFINGVKINLKPEMKVVASEILLRNQQPEVALTVMQPLDMEASADYFINFGRALMQIGILDQAKQCFIRATEREPENAEPLFHLGFQASLSGDAKSAIKHYSTALAIDPDHSGSLQNLSYLNYQLEQFDTAIEYAERVLELNQENLGGYLTIAASLNASGRFSESAEVIETARHQFGDSVIELDELESIAAFELGDYERALEVVCCYLESRPAAIDLRYIRAKSNIKLEHWDAALTDIEEFLELEPFDTQMREMRFNVLFTAKRWQEAELAYIKLLDVAPHLRGKYSQEYGELRKQLAIVIE